MKISVIMQSYLGEYPGSRVDSDKKFIRAIKSFIKQTHLDSELVIVSDGCEITHKLYHDYFKNNNRIKYAYVDKSFQNTHGNGTKYYRGLPREVGRSIADGKLICYMDSDDFLTKNALEILNSKWSNMLQYKDYKFAMTTAWYENCLSNIGDGLEIEDLPSRWIVIKSKKGTVKKGTFAISHLTEIDSKWKDISGDKSEDNLFIEDVYNKNMGLGFLIEEPYYIICHRNGGWDY